MLAAGSDHYDVNVIKSLPSIRLGEAAINALYSSDKCVVRTIQDDRAKPYEHAGHTVTCTFKTDKGQWQTLQVRGFFYSCGSLTMDRFTTRVFGAHGGVPLDQSTDMLQLEKSWHNIIRAAFKAVTGQEIPGK